MSRHYRGTPIPIPDFLNLLITVFSITLAIALLTLASRTQSWAVRIGCAILFSFIGNTIFSMLHESVHRMAHSRPKVNEWIGRVCAAFFPTSLEFQRQCHLGHHRRNRTDDEMFELYYPNNSRFLKTVQVYCILLGFYWTSSPIGALIYLVCPRLLNVKILRNPDSPHVTHVGFDAMISSIEQANPVIARLEIAFTIAVQVMMIHFFSLSLVGWLTCYWAFAINWGSLQYTDHAWSVRSIRDGAWNLRVNRWVRWIFLNYHHHLAHHQHPNVPWIHLGKFVDHAGHRPTFTEIYFRLWKGPTPTTEPGPRATERDMEGLW